MSVIFLTSQLEVVRLRPLLVRLIGPGSRLAASHATVVRRVLLMTALKITLVNLWHILALRRLSRQSAIIRNLQLLLLGGCLQGRATGIRLLNLNQVGQDELLNVDAHRVQFILLG